MIVNPPNEGGGWCPSCGGLPLTKGMRHQPDTPPLCLSSLKKWGAAMETWTGERTVILAELRTAASVRKRCWLHWRAASAVNNDLISTLEDELKQLEDREPVQPDRRRRKRC
jgi:hypothetical protein